MRFEQVIGMKGVWRVHRVRNDLATVAIKDHTLKEIVPNRLPVDIRGHVRWYTEKVPGLVLLWTIQGREQESSLGSSQRLVTIPSFTT